MDKELIVTLEIIAGLSMVLILLIQRPGVPSEKYAIRNDLVEFQRRRSEVAAATEREFGESHPVARLILFRAGGLLLFVSGLSIVLVTAPLEFDPKWIANVLIGFGLTVQLVAVVLYDYWGLSLSRKISKSVRVAVPAKDKSGGSW